MFASQLLRILETIPTDVKPETCGDMTMTENRSSTSLQGSSFDSKEICPLALNDFWNSDSRSSTEEEIQSVLIDPPNRLKVDVSYSLANRNVEETPSLNRCDPDPEDSMSRIDKTVVKCIDEETPLREDKVEKPKSKSGSESDDAAEDLTLKTEKDSVTSDVTLSDGSIEDSFIDRALPIQEFGTRSFLRSFFISLDSEGEDNQTVRFLDQISLDKGLPEGPTASSAEESMQASSSFSYNTRVESKIITFNFDSRPLEKSRTKGSSSDTRDKLDHRNSDSHNHSYSTHVHCQKDACTEKTEESLNVEDMMDKNVLNSDSDDVCVHVPKAKDDLSERGLEKHKHAETSFVTPEPIPIPGTGSISFHSDSSATSGNSFAFPVLQSEWNSSPVRMTKTDQRHFRKHKFWRSALLCCRF